MKLQLDQSCVWGSHQLTIDTILEKERSFYQEITITKNTFLGQSLFLNDRLIFTTKDADILHEYSVHIPMFTHPNPSSVLICGAGWGGFVNQAVKHSTLKSVTQCEIDDILTDLSIRHFPDYGLSIIEDKNQLLVIDTLHLFEHTAAINNDVLIVDWSSFFSKDKKPEVQIPIFKNLIKKDGILMLCVGSVYENPQQVQQIGSVLKKTFSKVFPIWAHMPSKIGGINLWFFCSELLSPALTQEHRKTIAAFNHPLSHYSAVNHSAALIPPKIILDQLRL